jgi:hypothetical protein
MDSKILVFPRFTPVTDHFHRRVFVGLKKTKIYIYFARRGVSRLQLSSFASWHCGVCTAIAKNFVYNSKSRLVEDKLLGM